MWRLRNIALAAALAAAQQTQLQPPPQQQTFRSATQIVEVDVRVFDGAGRFVGGLTRDDFEVLEDGVPQQIVTMSHVDTPAAEPTPARSAAGPPASGPAIPPSSAPRQTWIFFFDVNHLTPGQGFERARKAAADFIRERFREGDIGGVVDARGMVNNRLTSVRQELVAAVESVKTSGEMRSRTIDMTREWPRLRNEDEALQIAENQRDALQAAVTRACTDDPDMCKTVQPDAHVREKALRIVTDMRRSTQETLKTVNGLASGLAKMQGPKTIVFLSDGFVIGGMEGALRTVVGQAARAGARFYAIDVRGLNRGRGAGIIDQGLADDPAGPSTPFNALEDGINSLAVDTGGMMIRNENNVGRALDTILRDANVYYVLGYQPANAAFDGKFRSIEVRVKRPGVRVRARRGYLALEPSKMLVPQPIRRETSAPAEPTAAEASPVAASPPAATASTAAASVAAGRPDAVTAPVEEIRVRPDAGERVRALARDPGGTSPRNNEEAARGWTAYERGDLEAALPLFEQAAARSDAQPWTLYALGLTYAGLGKPQQALTAWERVRGAAPDYEPVYMDLAATHGSLGNLSAALAVLRDAEKRWPANPDVHNGLGVILVRRGALDQAIESFTKAAAAAPDHGVTHLNLGRAYELRYARDMRFVSSQRRWVGPEDDRKKAAASYERCVALGGPYAKQAAEALSRLQWSNRTG